jgi:23S rRNA (uridine2552-2'-O)-methyltransferase
MTVVDLGAAPGGWSQVLAPLVGPKGQVIAVDILDMEPLHGVAMIAGDFSEEATLKLRRGTIRQSLRGPCSSTMAPNISGVGLVDRPVRFTLPSWRLNLPAKG